jgi:hypothetical protein
MTAAETTEVVKSIDWEPIGDPVVNLPDAESDGMWSQAFRSP